MTLSQGKVKVQLASISFSSYEWIPYPAGVLIANCLQSKVISENFEFLLPEYRSKALDDPDFIARLKSADILGLTNWVWNQGYNDKISTLYKKYNANGLVIYGGANVPEDKDRAINYALERPFVDIFIPGPAEQVFSSFLEDYVSGNMQVPVGGFGQGEFKLVEKKRFFTDIKIISPYLLGIFDELISKAQTPLAAIFETNRGCPYSCSFCDWGGMTKSRVIKANLKEVYETISFIMSHDSISRIEIADANFGMFKDDVDIMKHLVEENHRREKRIDLTFGGMAKNGSPYFEEILSLMYENFTAYHDRKYVKLSFQSHDKEVLESAQRSNIDNNKLTDLAARLKQRSVEIDAEMIIALPGETAEKWLESIQKNMDMGVSHQKSFPLYVVPNTPMDSMEYREKYQLKTKKLLFPYDLYNLKSKDYDESRNGKNIISKCNFDTLGEYQVAEFVYQCYSYDSSELQEIYDIWFWMNTFYNARVARQFMLNSDLSAKEQYVRFKNLMAEGKMPFFRKLNEEYRTAVWDTIAKPEPITIVRDLFLVNFVLKFSFRGNEVVEVYDNQDIATRELKQLYPEFSAAHFKNGLTESERRMLYFVGADISR